MREWSNFKYMMQWGGIKWSAMRPSFEYTGSLPP